MIQNVVNDVFEKAKKECSSGAKGALSKHVAEKITEELKMTINERTLIRCYNKYILLWENIGVPIPENVNALCKYLGFKNYSEYQNNKAIPKSKVKTINDVTSQSEDNDTPEDKKDEDISGNNGSWQKKIVVIIISILSITLLYKNYNSNSTLVDNSNECMVWKETRYVKNSCNDKVDQKSGITVIPMDKTLMKSMRKVILKRSSIIFYKNGKPKYWYCKIAPNKVAFFTAPGLHPTSKKTLKAISKVIFNKYVPIHVNDKNSFVNSLEE